MNLGDYLAVAEAVLQVPAETLKHATRIGSAESALAAPFASFGGVVFYPSIGTQAAILCSRLIRNHPLPDGNKRVALLCMLLFLDLNGRIFDTPDQDEFADVIELLAEGAMPEEEFVAWVEQRVR
jgi:death-on-curing protein